MSFNNFQSAPGSTGSGEVFNISAITILSATKFEEGIKAGLFAKIDAGSLDNLDGSATPVVAGVVVRKVSSTMEENGSYVSTYNSSVDYVRGGMVTVEIKDGETPAKFGEVFASNLGDADDGKALTAAGIATGAEFIEAISATVWLVRLK